jgi:hypothetical protein
MSTSADRIGEVLGAIVAQNTGPNTGGAIQQMLAHYDAGSSAQLLGFLLDLNYDTLELVTCDAWKRNCGGVPRNSFIILKLNEALAGIPPGSIQPSVILARIVETATTPVRADIQNTIFQIHKVRAKIDSLTNDELQWGALKASILGTYFDTEDGKIGFGNDIDTFSSPHFYEIYVPERQHLEQLINVFVADSNPIPIGRLRYTETETRLAPEVTVRVSPSDFVANRTALFGKTRMGKSNTIKVILDTMLRTKERIGQVVYDLSGEYTYPDKQTGSSIYLEHRHKCSRYSMNPRTPDMDIQAGAAPPDVLRADFFNQVELGHSLLRSLYPLSEPGKVPDYIQPVLSWEPVDPGEKRANIKERFPDLGDRTRYERALTLYFCILKEAGFNPPQNFFVEFNVSKDIRVALAKALPNVGKRSVNKDGNEEVDDHQPIDAATALAKKLFELQDDDKNSHLFPPGSTGKAYFEPIHVSLLRMLGEKGITGAGKFTKFSKYHSPNGSNIVQRIVDDVQQGRTVLLDLAGADQTVTKHYSTLISQAILEKQMENFATQGDEKFAEHSVLFYFEEAHNLFEATDKDLTNVYNKLAKEGAKFRIGMVYATQSMTTLSPDLLKNTENFFIAHLNDDREIKEIERRYEFAGMGLDVQRARSKGYVRMITLSHRYALPVQIKLFKPGAGTSTPQTAPSANGALRS